MKQPALIIIKPDGIKKGIVGSILSKLDRAKLDIIGLKMIRTTRKQVEEHYKHIKSMSFFNETVSYFLGEAHKVKNLIAIIYYGENAIEKCRKIAGKTSPNDAAKNSIRGAYGVITKQGVFENVVHVSSTAKESRREIKIWFAPDEIVMEPASLKIKNFQAYKKGKWV